MNKFKIISNSLNSTKVHGAQIKLAALLMVFVAISGTLSSIINSAPASAASCHVFSPSVAGVGDAAYWTPQYTVPSSSGCSDINVAGITDTRNSGDHCAYMQVAFYPSSGGIQWGAEKTVCSSSSSDLKVLASDVRNGTKYRIYVDLDYNGQRYNFKIID